MIIECVKMDNKTAQLLYEIDADTTMFGKDGVRFCMDYPDDCIWWLAYEGEELVGFCAAEQRSEHFWFLRSSMVATNWRRKGIYRKLFDARMKYVLEQNPIIITVIASLNNRSMYEHLGFQPLYTYEEFDDVLYYKEVLHVDNSSES